MGLTRLPTDGTLYLDSCIIIYSLEKDPRYYGELERFWEAVQAGGIQPVTSTLTLLETLILPHRMGDEEAVNGYRRFLTQGAISLQPISMEVISLASELRGRYASLRTPDAIHVATALITDCDAIITNDKRLRAVEGLRILTMGG